MPKLPSLRATILTLAAASAGLASPALAAGAPKTQLVNCKAESCLLVTGRRTDASSTVSINGNPVSVEGNRKWRVRLPVETVRAWSAPFARSITVAVTDSQSRADAVVEADLPIGLLGHVENLAMLVVRVK